MPACEIPEDANIAQWLSKPYPARAVRFATSGTATETQRSASVHCLTETVAFSQELYNEGKKFRDKRRAQRAAAAAAEEEARLAAAAQAAAVADLSGAGREPQEA